LEITTLEMTELRITNMMRTADCLPLMDILPFRINRLVDEDYTAAPSQGGRVASSSSLDV
jgi:hypothetical protein